jgi:hypothetical protein
LCLDYFSKVDGWPLRDVFIGNCTVAMISPAQYAAFNLAEDQRLMEYARSIGARFMMHQDSAANPHLEQYAKLDYLHAFDLGQDTDFERLARLAPNVEVNCILFPSWIASHGMDEIAAELKRLMRVGKAFATFSFTCLEIDTQIGGDLLLQFHDTFRQCALESF